MSYTPDADDSAAPLNTEFASSAANEFRTLKAKINKLFLASSINDAQNSVRLLLAPVVINEGTNGDGGGSDLLFGFLGDAVRTAGDGSTLGGYFTANVGDNVTAAGSSRSAGILVESYSGVTNSNLGQQTGADINVIQRNNAGQTFVYGVSVRFYDRPSALDGGPVEGGLGSDLYNHYSVGMIIQSQRRSSSGEKCGWSRGIRFEDYSLDEDDTIAIPQAIDFTGLHLTDATGVDGVKSVPFHFHDGDLRGDVVIPGTIVPGNITAWVPIMVSGVAKYALPMYQIIA